MLCRKLKYNVIKYFSNNFILYLSIYSLNVLQLYRIKVYSHPYYHVKSLTSEVDFEGTVR